MFRVLRLSLCLLAWGANPAAGARYGPGPHWIDRVGAGLATFESVATVSVDIDGDGVADLEFAATGPTKVARSAASATGPTHRSHLDLEIYSMELTGEIPGLGPFRLVAGDGVPNLTRDGPLFSIGTSDEEANPRLAHDRFHVLFEVDVAGLVLHNEAPLDVEAIIDRLPPIGAVFRQSSPPVPVVTSAGATILRITDVVNHIRRPPSRACDPSGVDAPTIADACAEIGRECAGKPHCAARVARQRVQLGLLIRPCRSELRGCNGV